MTIKDMFRTRGSTYQFDTETGLYTTKGRRSTPKVFFGSVKPDMRVVAFGIDDQLDNLKHLYGVDDLVLETIVRGHTDDFTNEFVVGNRPIAIACNPDEITYTDDGKPVFGPELDRKLKSSTPNVKYLLGSPIVEVYHQAPEKEVQRRQELPEDLEEVSVFETARDMFTYDPKTRLIRRDGGSPKVFLGSVDPRKRVLTSDGFYQPVGKMLITKPGRYVKDAIFSGIADGFHTKFIEGHVALGLSCEPTDIVKIEDELIFLKEDFLDRIIAERRIGYEFSGPISKVHKQLTSEERGYTVL